MKSRRSRVLLLRAEDVVAQDASVLVGDCWSSASSAVGTPPRNVETSTVSRPHITCTILKRRPMMRERRNSSRTCSGVALVATSKSLGSPAEHQVAHRAADDECGVAVLLQRSRGLERARADALARDAV